MEKGEIEGLDLNDDEFYGSKIEMEAGGSQED